MLVYFQNLEVRKFGKFGKFGIFPNLFNFMRSRMPLTYIRVYRLYCDPVGRNLIHDSTLEFVRVTLLFMDILYFMM